MNVADSTRRMRPTTFLALLALAPALAGCSATKSPDVMATFYPLEHFTQRITGPDLTVASVVKPGREPHDYDATPQDLADIVHAKALVIQGAGFESWLRTAQGQAPGTRLIVATDGLTLKNATEEGAESPRDPHTWLDPVLAQQMVHTIALGLVPAFPDRAATFQANADRLVADLQALDTEFRQGLAHCEVPFVVTNHAAFAYMAARYNFTQISISGLDPNTEPDPQTVRHVVDVAKAHHVRIIFFEDLVSPAVSEAIAREVGAETRVLSPIESIAPDEASQGADYFSVMRMDLRNLREGMQCT